MSDLQVCFLEFQKYFPSLEKLLHVLKGKKQIDRQTGLTAVSSVLGSLTWKNIS